MLHSPFGLNLKYTHIHGREWIVPWLIFSHLNGTNTEQSDSANGCSHFKYLNAPMDIQPKHIFLLLLLAMHFLVDIPFAIAVQLTFFSSFISSGDFISVEIAISEQLVSSTRTILQPQLLIVRYFHVYYTYIKMMVKALRSTS